MKNGLAFEIILDNPKGKTPAKLTPCNTPTKTLTNEDIKNKLVKAEERRQVIIKKLLIQISLKIMFPLKLKSRLKSLNCQI